MATAKTTKKATTKTTTKKSAPKKVAPKKAQLTYGEKYLIWFAITAIVVYLIYTAFVTFA